MNRFIQEAQEYFEEFETSTRIYHPDVIRQMRDDIYGLLAMGGAHIELDALDKQGKASAEEMGRRFCAAENRLHIESARVKFEGLAANMVRLDKAVIEATVDEIGRHLQEAGEESKVIDRTGQSTTAHMDVRVVDVENAAYILSARLILADLEKPTRIIEPDVISASPVAIEELVYAANEDLSILDQTKTFSPAQMRTRVTQGVETAHLYSARGRYDRLMQGRSPDAQEDKAEITQHLKALKSKTAADLDTSGTKTAQQVLDDINRTVAAALANKPVAAAAPAGPSASLMTAFWTACKKGDDLGIKSCLDNGVPVNSLNANGETGLDVTREAKYLAHSDPLFDPALRILQNRGGVEAAKLKTP